MTTPRALSCGFVVVTVTVSRPMSQSVVHYRVLWSEVSSGNRWSCVVVLVALVQAHSLHVYSDVFDNHYRKQKEEDPKWKVGWFACRQRLATTMW